MGSKNVTSNTSNISNTINNIILNSSKVNKSDTADDWKTNSVMSTHDNYSQLLNESNTTNVNNTTDSLHDYSNTKSSKDNFSHQLNESEISKSSMMENTQISGAKYGLLIETEE